MINEWVGQLFIRNILKMAHKFAITESKHNRLQIYDQPADWLIDRSIVGRLDSWRLFSYLMYQTKQPCFLILCPAEFVNNFVYIKMSRLVWLYTGDKSFRFQNADGLMTLSKIGLVTWYRVWLNKLQSYIYTLYILRNK